MRDQFLSKIENGTVKIAVLGLGYVGLPLAEAYVRKGINVIGFDVSERRVDQLKRGASGMTNFANERVQAMVDSGLFKPTTDKRDLAAADALLICVPTPLDNYHHPDLSYVRSSCETIKSVLRAGQLVVLESTTYPGTTQDVMAPILEQSGLKADQDFFLAYSPEREDPGNVDYETSTIPKLVGADCDDGRAIADAVYKLIVETVPVANTRVAEAAKLTENIFRWVNIGLVNELKLIYDKMGIDVWDVIKAADTKPFGFMAFYPGPGVGGHCIRVDPYYLTWKAREHGMSTRFIELAGEVNIAMPKHVVFRLMEEMNDKLHKPLRGAKILLVGVAYKKDINDLRESPALELLDIMQRFNAAVDYYDPFIPMIEHAHEFPHLDGIKSIEFSEEKLATYDAVVVATPHSGIDFKRMAEIVPLMLDTRNVTDGFPEELLAKTAKA